MKKWIALGSLFFQRNLTLLYNYVRSNANYLIV